MESKQTPSRINELIKSLPVDQTKLGELLSNNMLEDIEVRMYGNKIGKAECAIKQAIRRLGVKLKVKNSIDRRHLVVKLHKHMKFIIIKIEA
ncbi:uncharacterized protein NEMAJ01_1005 [Nematocida major]|uniref:uncharacterized protein n=1 Tax=Nematocida major TaxID=1912982 RepID=UPI002008BD0A|nr:uncharacterized protein NEMAJ01_1005 [Nematocida major]KAH9386109.1 hypothetical protein NEMAJ01_1005 [Nematocida major]